MAKVLRVLLLALYVGLILCLLGSSVGSGAKAMAWAFGITAFTLVSQGIFLYVPGRLDLCRPIVRRRLWAPAIVAGLMFAVLAGALGLAFTEFFNKENDPGAWTIVLVEMATNWIVWGLLFLSAGRNVSKFRALKRMVLSVIGGSLLELLVNIPVHVVVSRRPGCLVGLQSAMGIVAGIYVLFWAFGPGIILLFWRDRLGRKDGSA